MKRIVVCFVLSLLCTVDMLQYTLDLTTQFHNPPKSMDGNGILPGIIR